MKKHSHGKPIMVFCMTRNITISTAKLLCEKWKTWDLKIRPWKAPTKKFGFKDKDIQYLAECGVAVHHAGMDVTDRTLVESLYLKVS